MPEIRELFAGQRFEEVETTHTVSEGAATRAEELLITRGDRLRLLYPQEQTFSNRER